MLTSYLLSYRHQLNHTPKQIYNCDFDGCTRTFVRQDLCNRHRDRHTAKGSQLHRKDSMLSQGSPTSQVPQSQVQSIHGSTSPEMTRQSLNGPKIRTTQIKYESPQDLHPSSYSPVMHPASGSHPSAGTNNGADTYPPAIYKRPDTDMIPRSQNSSSAGSNSRVQRHQSFGTPDSKPVEFPKPLPRNVNNYGMLPTASNNQVYRGNQPHSPQAYISQQNFPPFSLPPSGFANVTANAIPSREPEPPFQSPISTEYPNEINQTQQSGSDMMLLDQMTTSNIMPVFGGEGCYNRSPFAIPEDFVAYLFSSHQNDMGHMNQQSYAK